MKAKNLKRSFLLSVLSLVLCVSMFVGTTFAWFTDTVKSEKNKIMAGNLDIELYYMNDETTGWTLVDEDTNVFKEKTLWEPGHTEVVKLKVVNEGTLALKYQLGVNVFEETKSVNQEGKEFKLSDYIKYGVTDKPVGDGRDAAIAAAEQAGVNPLNVDYTKAGTLLAKGESIVTMVVYMPTTVGNEANYAKNAPIPEILLGLNLYATQMANEQDSFGKTYDENASYPGYANSADELRTALTEGKNVKLGKDIDLAGMAWEPIASYSGIFDGNGYTISNLTVNSTAADAGMFASLSGATIKNLTLANVNVTTTGNRAGAVAGQIAKDPAAPQTIIENVTVSGTVSGNYYAGGIVGADRSYDTLIKGCVNTAAVTGNQQVGGIVGQANRLTVIDSCSNSGKITADYIIAGGIIGLVAGDDKGGNTNLMVTVQNCVNSGVVSDSKGDLVGGIAGAIGRDGGDPIVDTITAYLVGCKVADGQKLYGAKYNYCSGKDEMIVVITDDNAITSADELAALGGTKINGTYALMADIDMTGKAMKSMEVSGGATVNFIGNGHTISNLTLNAAGIHGMTGASEVAGLFDLTAPATTVSLTVSDLTIKDATVACSKYAATVVGYNPNGGTTITLNNVDVAGATVTAETVAALVGYTTGAVNLTDCDVSGLALTGEAGRPDKVGAYIGTANGANCVVTATNCTDNTAYKYAGRVIYDATMTVDGVAYVTNADALSTAVTNGATKVLLADGEYDLKGIQKDGLTLIGEGDNVKMANTTDYAGNGSLGAIWKAVNLQNMTITNTVWTQGDGGNASFTKVNFAAGFRQGYGKDVVFTDCSFGSNSEGYALHFQTDSASEGGNIALSGCEFEGGKVHLGGKRAYTFTDCDFAAGTDFQVWSGITLDGCTVDGVEVTAENIGTLFPNLNLEKVTVQ